MSFTGCPRVFRTCIVIFWWFVAWIGIDLPMILNIPRALHDVAPEDLQHCIGAGGQTSPHLENDERDIAVGL